MAMNKISTSSGLTLAILILAKMFLKLSFFVRLMVWCNRFKQRKTFKKEISKELIPVKSRDWYVPEDKKNKERTIFNC